MSNYFIGKGSSDSAASAQDGFRALPFDMVPPSTDTAGKSKPPAFSALARDHDTTTVLIGPARQEYRVFTALLSHYSKYFKKALRGPPWKEAEDRVVELPDIEPEVFNIFLDWLFTQTLPQKNEQWIPRTDGMQVDSWRHNRLVDLLRIKAYVFADRFVVPDFRRAVHNHLADALIEYSNPPFYEVVIYAFANLPTRSRMLRLLVNLHCVYWKESCDKSVGEELKLRAQLPFEFLVRVMIRYSKMKGEIRVERLIGRACHEHGSDEERDGCSRCADDTEYQESEADEEEESAVLEGDLDRGNEENDDRQAGGRGTVGDDDGAAEQDVMS